jgi:hypothetical protein
LYFLQLKLMQTRQQEYKQGNDSAWRWSESLDYSTSHPGLNIRSLEGWDERGFPEHSENGKFHPGALQAMTYLGLTVFLWWEMTNVSSPNDRGTSVSKWEPMCDRSKWVTSFGVFFFQITQALPGWPKLGGEKRKECKEGGDGEKCLQGKTRPGRMEAGFGV